MITDADKSVYNKIITAQLNQSAKLNLQLKIQKNIILKIAEEIANALSNGNKVLIFGNGGSAADAQHIAAELAGKFYRDREPLPVIALTTNTSILTAIANDFGYEDVFSRQVCALAKTGDIVIGISTSGNSENIILALEEAKKHGALTIALTGSGGELTDISDVCLAIPSVDTPRIQEMHITAGHIICNLIEEIMFGDGYDNKQNTL